MSGTSPGADRAADRRAAAACGDAAAGVGIPTVGAALRAATARLAEAGVAEPRADAEVLLAHALGTSRAGVVAHARDPLGAPAAARFAALLARRAGREPVAQLVGEREFWSLPFAVDRRVLVPRPESELVVETALALAPAARRVLDVGTGSGALAVALARELPRAGVVALDRSAEALAVARANVARLAPRVRLVRADLGAPFAAASFDLVVSNPPYVATAALAELAPEVREHEPRLALDGGPDGLDSLRALLAEVPRVLVAGGWLVLEMGAGQAAAVTRAADARGCWCGARILRDAAGIERVLAVRLERAG